MIFLCSSFFDILTLTLHNHKSSTACRAVKINSVSVPSLHELREDSGPLILDCDFSVENEETGFVLKWLHNTVAIYQWIPSKKVPFALVNETKGNILKLNY